MEPTSYLRFILVLFLLLGLIFLAAWAARRFGLVGALGGATRGSGRTRRLRVVESQVIDTRRRLVLVSRDGVEHLLLIGGNGGDVVVERAIEAPRFNLPEAPFDPPPNDTGPAPDKDPKP